MTNLMNNNNGSENSLDDCPIVMRFRKKTICLLGGLPKKKTVFFLEISPKCFLLLTFIRKKYTVLCMDKSNVDKKIMDSKRLESHSRIEILKQAGFMQLLDLN